MPLQINHQAVQHARQLIESRQYARDTVWSKVEPTAEDENQFLEKHGYAAYANWHLAVNTDASPETKKRYEFPFGDFHRLHRSALIAIKQRAAHEAYHDIEDLADDLLQAMPEAA